MQQQQPPPAAYQPPPPGYGGVTVIHTAPPVQQNVIFRDRSVLMTCPYCHASITTMVTYESGVLTWIIAGGLIIMGLWLGCCLIPFFINACKDCIHSCPNCHQVVGKHCRL